MKYEHVMRWLAAWRARTILSCILGAVGGMALSLVLLALAWAFIFMVSIHVLGGWVPYFSGWIHPLVATVAIPLLFIGNACVSQETLGKYSFTTGTATDKLVTIPGYGSNVNPLGKSRDILYGKSAVMLSRRDFSCLCSLFLKFTSHNFQSYRILLGV